MKKIFGRVGFREISKECMQLRLKVKEEESCQERNGMLILSNDMLMLDIICIISM